MKHLFSFYIIPLLLLLDHFSATDCGHAVALGDIMIGGLFPVHESVDVTPGEDGRDIRTCNRFTPARLVQSLIMVQAVEEINRSGKLGNLTLGYNIADSCSDVTVSLRKIRAFMRRNCTNDPGQTSPPVLAVIGGYHSEISIAVTRQLNLENIPQISYGSTSGFLSDKTRFPSFMRTVPEDDHQARAIVNILKNRNWTWVGVVTTDGDYGRYAVDRLQWHAAEHNICFAFTSVLPDVLGENTLKNRINSTVTNIIENENVTVIVSFAKPRHMMYLFQSLLKHDRGRGKTWVASDNWSQSSDVLGNWTLSDVGTIFGTTLKSGNTTRLEKYINTLDVNPDHQENNTLLSEYLRCIKKTQKPEHDTGGDPECDFNMELNDTATDVLIKMIYPYAVFSVELAVRAIAEAVKDLCVNRDCKTSHRLQPLELRRALWRATFQMDGKNYSFDKRGDLNSGYDVILWRQTSPSFVDVHYIVGYYSQEDQNLRFLPDTKSEDFHHVIEQVISRCSEPCLPGYRKQLKESSLCCSKCIQCNENYFSNTTDSIKCFKCGYDEYSTNGSQECSKRTTVYLEYEDKYHTVLLFFSALGALLTIVVGIIFLAYWKTPVVKASVGSICILLLFSIMSTFASVTLFGGPPSDLQCRARQVVFGLSFTLSVSCIMVKSFKIVLAFEFDPSVKRVLEKLYKPYIIIAVCLSGQIIICILWLVIKPPERAWENMEKTERLHYCDEKSTLAFAGMLVYIAILAVICFGVAFKSRKLPQSYNNAKFITFSMLIYLICWTIFVPVHINVKGKYLPAVEMVVILISAYGILFCQFFTKCYIIMFKQEANTESAFLRDVRNFSLGSISELESGNLVSSAVSSGGIQNPALNVASPVSDSLSASMSSGLSSHGPSPDSNTQLSNLQSSQIFRRRLRRYLSLPETFER